ncbi:hypothetical protein M9H77_12703 [Catharanthus roseus]|uniref:Uncharacterized protein n=1 Tax=Catharanthus roseus TaxID=4058 RepID=A0ACC0BIB5_CATRO|nr:hypothetical protein M9H77_12703 [Catharanthus roseus]
MGAQVSSTLMGSSPKFIDYTSDFPVLLCLLLAKYLSPSLVVVEAVFCPHASVWLPLLNLSTILLVEELQLLNQGVSQYFQVFSLQRLSNLVRMLDGISGNASIKWIGMEATVDLI